MIHRDRFQTFALCALLTLPLGAAACSQGASPTEPALDLEATSASAVTSTADDGRGRGRGGNDGANVDRQGRRGRRGNDDAGNNRRGRRGRGNDDRPEDQRPAQAGRQFEGAVAAVGATSLTLVGGTVVTVDGATQWVARGDLFSLADVSASLSGGFSPRVEGRGPRQADGSILARTIKAEDNK